jgi:hypothetical protein
MIEAVEWKCPMGKSDSRFKICARSMRGPIQVAGAPKQGHATDIHNPTGVEPWWRAIVAFRLRLKMAKAESARDRENSSEKGTPRSFEPAHGDRPDRRVSACPRRVGWR